MKHKNNNNNNNNDSHYEIGHNNIESYNYYTTYTTSTSMQQIIKHYSHSYLALDPHSVNAKACLVYHFHRDNIRETSLAKGRRIMT